MTKRMLSLLLALVMTLSLCVPALAADEFAAEAVTEVEEQAPEAPEAPVEPEAEEPAEEPVVDEPAAEEPAEDAPEMASVMPEDMSDEPLLVALGVISNKAHWELYKALQLADEIMPKVEAGEVRVPSVTWNTSYDVSKYDADKPETYPFAKATGDFVAVYNKAKTVMDGINGVDVDFDVTENVVTTAADNLNKLVDDENHKTTALTDEASANMTAANLYNLYNNAKKVYTSGYIINKDTDVTKEAWTKAYHADYLTALDAVLDTIADYDGKTYADFAAAVNDIIALLGTEAAAGRPAADDMAALDAAIAKAEAVKDTYKDDASKYVLGSKYETTFATLIKAAKDLKSDTQGLNGFATGKTYADYNKAIDDINAALAEKTNTIKYETNKLNDKNVNIIVSVTDFDGTAATDGDGKVYGIAYKVGNVWYAGAGKTGAEEEANASVTTISNANFAEDGKYSGKYVQTLTLAPISANGAFASGDQIVIKFYEQVVLNGTTYWEAVGSEQTITVSDGYVGPELKSAKVSKYNDTATDYIGTYTAGSLLGANPAIPGLSKKVTGKDVEIEVTLTGEMPAVYTNYKINVKGSDGKVAVTANAPAISDKKITINTADEYLVAGSVVSIELAVSTTGTDKNDYIARGSDVTVTVDPLSKWSAVSTIEKVLADVDKIVESDYKMDSSGRSDVTTVAQAVQTMKNDAAKISSSISSTTLANSQKNRNSVLADLSDLLKVRTYITPKAGDTRELDKLLNQAHDLLNAKDTEEYTFDSWGKLNDLYTKYTTTSKLGSATLQSKIDAAADEVEAAINALTKDGAVSKTALNASIAAAEALKETDYTAESWAANKAAIDAALAAAKTVAANESATQAQVDAAKAALDAAVAKLEKVGGGDEPGEEGPKAPANGTGWNYYNGEWYFFKNNKLVANYWVGKIDGASQWDSNWYYVGADGKMLTGMQYVDDLHGGYGWYFLQPTDTKGEIGKMLTGYQWVGGNYGECYFSTKSGESGKCTWSQLLGTPAGATWGK